MPLSLRYTSVVSLFGLLFVLNSCRHYLEPYKKNFYYTHWDKLTSVILEAGKYRGEQYVVPMSYTLPITLFKKQNVQHIHSIDMTWDNMIDETIELRIAAVANSSVHSGNAFFPW